MNNCLYFSTSDLAVFSYRGVQIWPSPTVTVMAKSTHKDKECPSVYIGCGVHRRLLSLPCLTLLICATPSVGRGWAHRSHRQVWLRGPIIPRVVLQEGRLAAAVPACVRRLVGGTAQWHRWPGATPVHRGPRCVSFSFVLSWTGLSGTQVKSRTNLHTTSY